jgi:hypothetical protein
VSQSDRFTKSQFDSNYSSLLPKQPFKLHNKLYPSLFIFKETSNGSPSPRFIITLPCHRTTCNGTSKGSLFSFLVDDDLYHWVAATGPVKNQRQHDTICAPNLFPCTLCAVTASTASSHLHKSPPLLSFPSYTSGLLFILVLLSFHFSHFYLSMILSRLPPSCDGNFNNFDKPCP